MALLAKPVVRPVLIVRGETSVASRSRRCQLSTKTSLFFLSRMPSKALAASSLLLHTAGALLDGLPYVLMSMHSSSDCSGAAVTVTALLHDVCLAPGGGRALQIVCDESAKTCASVTYKAGNVDCSGPGSGESGFPVDGSCFQPPNGTSSAAASSGIGHPGGVVEYIRGPFFGHGSKNAARLERAESGAAPGISYTAMLVTAQDALGAMTPPVYSSFQSTTCGGQPFYLQQQGGCLSSHGESSQLVCTASGQLQRCLYPGNTQCAQTSGTNCSELPDMVPGQCTKTPDGHASEMFSC